MYPRYGQQDASPDTVVRMNDVYFMNYDMSELLEQVTPSPFLLISFAWCSAGFLQPAGTEDTILFDLKRTQSIVLPPACLTAWTGTVVCRQGQRL